LVTDQGLSNKQLRALTGLAKSTLSEHLTYLLEQGIVVTRPTVGDGLAYKLENPERIQMLIRSQGSTLLKKVTDRFIELWEF
jgi:predicted transcriptional regulator